MATIQTKKSSKKDLVITKDNFLTCKKALRAFDHPLRKGILDAIEEDEQTVTDIYIKMRQEQSVVSSHLAILKRFGLVISRREGKFVYYVQDLISVIALESFSISTCKHYDGLIGLDSVTKAYDVYRVLAHDIRLSILEFIDESKSTEVNKIYGQINIEQSMCSQHLKMLRDIGVIVFKKVGKFSMYSIDYKVLQGYILEANLYCSNEFISK